MTPHPPPPRPIACGLTPLDRWGSLKRQLASVYFGMGGPRGRERSGGKGVPKPFAPITSASHLPMQRSREEGKQRGEGGSPPSFSRLGTIECKPGEGEGPGQPTAKEHLLLPHDGETCGRDPGQSGHSLLRGIEVPCNCHGPSSGQQFCSLANSICKFTNGSV